MEQENMTREGHHKRRAAAGAGGDVTYDTFNPSDKSAGITLTESDLVATSNQGVNTFHAVRGIIPFTGNTYIEFTREAGGTAILGGIGTPDNDLTGATNIAGFGTGDGAALLSVGGDVYMTSIIQGTLAALAVGGVIGMAYRRDDNELYVRDSTGYIAGTDPVTRTNPITLVGMSGKDALFTGTGQSIADAIRYKSGSTAFSFPVPTGYKSGNFS